MRAGEKRKFYKNMEYNRSARTISVIGLRLFASVAPILLVAMACVGVYAASAGHTSAGVLTAGVGIVGLPNLKMLRQLKTDVKIQADAVLAKAAGESRALTDDERKTVSGLVSQIENINGDMVLLEKLADEERSAPAVTVIPAGQAGRVEIPNAGKKPFASLGEQLVAVVKAGRGGKVDDRLLELNAAASGGSEGVPADGGFNVQTDFSTVLLDKSHETGIIARKVFRIPLGENSNSIKLPAVDETSRVTGSRWGGIQVYYAAEADTVAAKKPKFRNIELALKKLFGISYATDELLQDFSAYEAILNRALPEEFGYQIDDDILNGTGAGKPLGINVHPSLVVVAKEAAQAAASVVAANVLKMFARMPARLVGGAEWYINQDVLPQLPQMIIGTQPVYMPPTGLSGATPFGTLLGRPINVIEQAETVGTQGDIIFANFGEYVMIEKGGLQSASSMHVRFLNDEMTFRWTLRLDGQPGWNAALTPAKGANTLSPFVELAVRA
jgi:HK97 family phage major capsid protein